MWHFYIPFNNGESVAQGCKTVIVEIQNSVRPGYVDLRYLLVTQGTVVGITYPIVAYQYIYPLFCKRSKTLLFGGHGVNKTKKLHV